MVLEEYTIENTKVKFYDDCIVENAEDKNILLKRK